MVDGKRTTRLFAPRQAIRTKLHWSAGTTVRSGIAYGPAFGIDGSTVMVETHGADEQAAMDALLALIADKFGEGE